MCLKITHITWQLNLTGANNANSINKFQIKKLTNIKFPQTCHTKLLIRFAIYHTRLKDLRLDMRTDIRQQKLDYYINNPLSPNEVTDNWFFVSKISASKIVSIHAHTTIFAYYPMQIHISILRMQLYGYISHDISPIRLQVHTRYTLIWIMFILCIWGTTLIKSA